MDLTDAQQMHREIGEKFEVPNDEELAAIAPGDCVKVSNGYDRFWVLVSKKTDDVISGTVNNKLVGPVGKFGDLIHLESRHVYDISKRRKDQ